MASQPAVQPETQRAPFPSRFPGVCILCRKRIEKGMLINWTGRGQASHVDCAAIPSAAQPVPQPVPVPSVPVPVAVPKKAKAKKAFQPVAGEHAKFGILDYLIRKGHHVYLYGAPGSGKSSAAQRIAKKLGLQYGYIALNPQTSRSDLLGFIHANGAYVETVFYQCYKNGGIFCIDEMDNAGASLLTTLNGALENGQCAFPCGMVARHKNFIVVATGNTCGRGASPQFPDRRPFDVAFGERFSFLEWDYDAELERNVTLGINADAGVWLEWVANVRAYCQTNYPRVLASPRASFKGSDYLLDGFLSAEQIADMLVFKGIDKATRQAILRAYPLPMVSE